MTGVVVADAGPLIGLARIDCLSFLKSLYGTLAVPEAVLTELRLESGRPGSRVLAAAFSKGAIGVRTLAPGREAELARLCLGLDAGEASAILLAEQNRCRFLLIDERRGREVARRRGIPVVGLAGILLAAKRAGLLKAIRPVLEDLSRQGYRLSDALFAEVLNRAGESG